jgi:hypothetical protein
MKTTGLELEVDKPQRCDEWILFVQLSEARGGGWSILHATRSTIAIVDRRPDFHPERDSS